ncbi:hypothetical protein CKO28_27070 [Rhodovibrio sodomensis]|uniref:Phasin domain-containing protein n=1 Tax=Rhodovibrio sodomensis TaxID=1088 RepID=A0ABS1DN36_9PROT|nr:hypothetical protein [Rhodovibrio sodomensis]MBK1671654.1 hypothetical protein [Rhodovibrio sodomensis]
MIDRVSELWDPSTFAEAGSRATDLILDRQRRNVAAVGRAQQQLMQAAQTMVVQQGQMLQETASEAANRLQRGQEGVHGTDWPHAPNALGEAVVQVHGERLPDVVETATSAYLKAAEILFERVQAGMGDLSSGFALDESDAPIAGEAA